MKLFVSDILLVLFLCFLPCVYINKLYDNMFQITYLFWQSREMTISTVPIFSIALNKKNFFFS